MTSWTPGGVSAGGPLRSYRTGSPAARTRVNRPSRSDRPGSGCRSFQAAVGPQDAEQAAGLGERLPGGARHAPDRLAGLGGRASDRGQGAVGKGHDDGEVVRHAVVHLAGDAGPLHRRGQGAGLVVFAFESLGPVAQLGQVRPAGAHVQACDQDTRDRDDLVDRGQPAVMPAALAGRGISAATASAAATSAVVRLIVTATVYRAMASATGNSAPRTGHWASTAAIRTVTANTGPGQTRRSDSTRAVKHRDDQADRQRRERRVRGLGEGKAPERRCRGEQGAADVEDPGTQRARSRVLDRCPEGHTCILAAFPGGQASRRRSRQAARAVSTTA